MEEPKKIYKPEDVLQAKQDLITAVKKTVDEFEANSNVQPLVKYETFGIYMEITD